MVLNAARMATVGENEDILVIERRDLKEMEIAEREETDVIVIEIITKHMKMQKRYGRSVPAKP